MPGQSRIDAPDGDASERERLLGDADYVESVLSAAGEGLEKKCRIRRAGYVFEDIVTRASEVFHIPVVKTRPLTC